MKKRLGIDIDGTITRPDSILPYINQAFEMNLTLKDITEYDLSPFVNIPKNDFAKWFIEKEPIIYAESALTEGAKETLEELAPDNELYFISARSNKLLEVTENWFRENQLTYEHIELIGSHDKVATAKKHAIDLFFEDKHDNAVAISEECKIPVILFNTPYNQDTVPERVIRVDTWIEAKKWIDGWLKLQAKR